MKDNKLIAEFMGWDIESLSTIPSNLHPSNLELDNDEVLEYKYHTSWDWLMPVLSKILDLSFQDDGDAEDFYSIRDCVPDINHTHKAVVEFIKTYNDER
jgi:hypothetical protein